MVNVNDIEIKTEEGTAGWTATSTAYPDFTGAGQTEQEAKEDLVNQINGAEGSENTNESTEG